jgi:hypothetical protein
VGLLRDTRSGRLDAEQPASGSAPAGRLQDICDTHAIAPSGVMSTNGLLRASALLAELVELGGQRYPITSGGANQMHGPAEAKVDLPVSVRDAGPQRARRSAVPQ